MAFHVSTLPGEVKGLQGSVVECTFTDGPDISKIVVSTNKIINNLFYISRLSVIFIHSFVSEFRTPYPANVTAFNGAFSKADHPMLISVLRDKDK